MRNLALIVLMVFLSGCMTLEERRRAEQAHRNAVIKMHGDECLRFGFVFGSKEFGGCMLKKDQIARQMESDRMTQQMEKNRMDQEWKIEKDRNHANTMQSIYNRNKRDRIKCSTRKSLGGSETTCE